MLFMPHKLPSLNALRAFEAAARHMSFVRAAEELNVTPGAISQQVRQLEDSLGQLLFIRQNNALSMTFAGKALLPQVKEAFDTLSEVTDLVRSKNFENILKISAPPTFTTKWLRPRLVQFQCAHPDLEIRLTASKQLADFNKENLDLAIRYGSGIYENLVSEKIMTEDIFPVCSPSLRHKTMALRSIEDLANHTLIHSEHSVHDDTAPNWNKWLRHVSPSALEKINTQKGVFYTPASLAIDAAIAGEGIALAKGAWVQDDIAADRLVQPFDDIMQSEFAYYLVYPHGTPSSRVALFRTWLFETLGRNPVSQISTNRLAASGS